MTNATTTPVTIARDVQTLHAAAQTIEAGNILHVRADRLVARRTPRRDAMPAVDLTVGPTADGGHLVVDYARVRSGEEERFSDAEAAIRAVRRRLGWDRIPALRTALVRIYGEPERTSNRCLEDARTVAAGERLHRAYGHRPAITGPIFGPR